MQKTDRTALLGYLTAPISGVFGRRRPLFFIFIACESLFGCRVVFARTDHLQGFFQNFIASGMQTFDRGMYRYIDPHTRRAGVRIVRIINSETEST